MIHAITEFDKPFVWTTTGKAFQRIGEHLDVKVNLIDYKKWPAYLQYANFQVKLVLFESVYLELINATVRDLRIVYPNAKLVCLGSDTIYYITTGKNGGYQIKYPQELDLFLEKMDPCIEEYKKRGVNVDGWMWTISEYLIDRCSKYQSDEKLYDFIGVYAPHTINREGSYRNRMVNYIRDSAFTFTQGGGTGHEDQDLDRLFTAYSKSRFTLGTTSHDNPAFHGMKGFRDWIGPFMGSLLIYDDYPEIISKFDGGATVPIYGYGNFEELIEVANYFTINKTHYNALLEKQKEWARKNTIEEQLLYLLEKHRCI